MKEITFIQRSRGGRALFQVRGTHLSVSGMYFNLETDLQEVSPDFERGKRRAYQVINFFLAVAAACALLMRLLEFLPPGLYTWVEVFGSMFIVISLWGAARFIRPLEIVRFKNRSGARLFDVIKEKDQAVEFEQFIEDLQRAILRKEVAGPAPKLPAASSVSYP